MGLSEPLIGFICLKPLKPGEQINLALRLQPRLWHLFKHAQVPCPFWHAALICQSVIDRSALVLITGAKMQKHDSISRHIKKKKWIVLLQLCVSSNVMAFPSGSFGWWRWFSVYFSMWRSCSHYFLHALCKSTAFIGSLLIVLVTLWPIGCFRL